MKKITDKRIGIIGGGQLGKMMILEAKRLGMYVITLDPSPECPSHSISDELIVGSLGDENAIFELAQKVDVITYEFEHINAEALVKLEQKGYVIYPTATSLCLIKDKFHQKAKLRENNICVPDFELIKDFAHLCTYAKKNGYPIMLKNCKDSYDGKGNYLIRTEQELQTGFDELKGNERNLMVEEFIDFDMEVSVIATRSINGDKVIFPIAHNVHVNNVLETTTIPALIPDHLKTEIHDMAEKVMDVFDGVGTFCVEMFVGKGAEKIYINEVAPRPHNSGHYTIEGCRVNQYENHIRAILGLPLGSTKAVHNAVIMRNLLGQSNGKPDVQGLEEACAQEGVNVHVYGKRESRIARKMGHYTVTAESLEKAKQIDEALANVVKIV